jgi:hypothetical protein
MSNKCISQTRKELERYATFGQINGKAIVHLETITYSSPREFAWLQAST